MLWSVHFWGPVAVAVAVCLRVLGPALPPHTAVRLRPALWFAQRTEPPQPQLSYLSPVYMPPQLAWLSSLGSHRATADRRPQLPTANVAAIGAPVPACPRGFGCRPWLFCSTEQPQLKMSPQVNLAPLAFLVPGFPLVAFLWWLSCARRTPPETACGSLPVLVQAVRHAFAGFARGGPLRTVWAGHCICAVRRRSSLALALAAGNSRTMHCPRTQPQRTQLALVRAGSSLLMI
jgi:hypothetical protein